MRLAIRLASLHPTLAIRMAMGMGMCGHRPASRRATE